MLTGVIKILPKSKLHRLPSADGSFHDLSGLKFKADKDYIGSTELPYHCMYQFHDFICGLQKTVCIRGCLTLQLLRWLLWTI